MHRVFFPLPLILLAAGVLAAQQPPPDDRLPGSPMPREMAQGPPPPAMRPGRPPMERAFHGGPPGRWWTDPTLVQKLGLNADQQKRIDGLFQQSRLKLIDLSAALQREEAILEPLLEADRPDESQVLAQIDHVAQARAELEKANARMLLGFRGVLTLDQWKKLQSEEGPGRPGGDPRRRPDRPQ
jgi:Spy/CpxP family protein refolding chaperone